MVRLKVQAKVRSGLFCKFQFQHGAIKSGDFDEDGELVEEFQFQHGAIKSYYPNDNHPNL